MIAHLLNEETTRAWIEPEDWRAAGRAVGDMLVNTGGVEPAYIEEMIQNIEEMGPYIVIIPGVALFHTKGDKNVHKVCLSLATVKDGVLFGVPKKDPVKLLMAFASPDKKEHLTMLREIMSILKNQDMMRAIVDAPTDGEILHIIRENFS